MQLSIKLFRFFIFFIFFSLITTHLSLLTREAHAAGEFDTAYNVLYDISQSGETTVTQNITLRNKTANHYAEKFELKIGSTKVSDVKAQDNTGELQTDVKFENNLTSITVIFAQKVIGLEKSLPLTLTYKSAELTSKSGQIWEVSIPKLAKSEDISSYSVTVSVPGTFGPIAFSAPQPAQSTKSSFVSQFTFTREQLNESGIAMSFGQKQVFSFSLDYYLENRNFTNQQQAIALPPDNNYQRIVLTKIDPAPLDVNVDADNNFLAMYKLSSGQRLSIKVEGYVEVFSKPFRNIFNKLTEDQRKTYTASQKYWEIDNGPIRDQASKLKTPKEIYNFVSNTLSYSQERLNQAKIERKGAAAALLNPKDSICVEFTDLFIAIARSAEIPAREVEGYAYTQNERLRPLSLTLNNGDILHAWPEYWDDNLGWVQVDPTWGATSGGLDYFNKMDFNHISFVSRGETSTYPYPAGSYKNPSNLNGKNVNVSFAENLPVITTTPSLNIIVPSKIMPIVPVAVRAEVKNVGTSTIFNSSLTLATQKLKNLGNLEEPQLVSSATKNSIPISILPPYANRTYVYRLQSKSLWSKNTDDLTLSLNDTRMTKHVELIPVYDIIFLRGLAISSLVALIITSTGLFLYRKTHKKTPKVHFW